MAYIREQYFHIVRTPDVIEANEYGSRGTHYTGENYVKAILKYERGNDGFTNKQRGYYMELFPIGYGKNDCGHWESYGLFSSQYPRQTVQFWPVSRASKKAETEAAEYFDEQIFGWLRFLYGYEVETEPETR